MAAECMRVRAVYEAALPKAEALVKEALAASNESLYRAIDKVTAVDKGKACRGRENKAAKARLLDEWYAERAGDSPSHFHNSLGEALGAYLMDARRAMESGAFDEAQRGLNDELKKK